MIGDFLNSDVARIVEITQRQVLSWTEKGLIRPATEAQGAGTRRIYSYQNLLEFGLVKYLFRLGLGIQMTKAIMLAIDSLNIIHEWVLEFHDEWYIEESRQLDDLYTYYKSITDEERRDFVASEIEEIKVRMKLEGPIPRMLYIYPGPEQELFGIRLLDIESLRSIAGGVIVDLIYIKRSIDNRI